VVIVDGSFVGNSQIKVYVKTQGPDTPNSNFDDNDYEELFPEGNPGVNSAGDPDVQGKFAELKPKGPVGGVMRFTTNNLLPGIKAGEFTQYQIKIVLMGEDVGNLGNASQIPVIDTISAVPLRRISQDEIRRYTPPGSVFAWTTDTAPFGFVFCDGTEYDITVNPEMKVLLEAISNQYGGNGTTTFAVPNLKGRTIVGQNITSGVGAGNDDEGQSFRTRSIGTKYGAEDHKLLRGELPEHEHALGRPSDTSTGANGYQSVRKRQDGSRPDGEPLFQTRSAGQDDDANKFKGNQGVWAQVGSVKNITQARPIAGPASPFSGEGNADGTVASLNPGNVKHPEADEFSMQSKRHNNEQPSFVLNYIIKI